MQLGACLLSLTDLSPLPAVPVREDLTGGGAQFPFPHHREAGLVRPGLRACDQLREGGQRDSGEATAQNSVPRPQQPCHGNRAFIQ